MDFRRRLGVMVPVTCTYWRNASCFRGDRCTFVHGFICRDDGICSDPLCNKAHFKQRDPCTYLKAPVVQTSTNTSPALLTVTRSHTITQSSRDTRETRETRVVRTRHRSKSRSPKRKSRSPYSPKRRQSPPRRSPRKSRTPSYSPKSRSRSPSRGRSRRSRSRSRSRSQRRRSYSPYKKPARSKSRSRSRSRSTQSSPCRKSVSPGSRSSSSSSSGSPEKKESERLSKEKLKIIRSAEKKLDDALVIKGEEDMFIEASKDKEVTEKDSKPKFKPIGDLPSKIFAGTSREKEALKKTSPEMSPSSRALEILKNLPKEFFNSSEENNETVVEEKVSSLKTNNEEESFKEAFFKALNKSGNESDKSQTDHLPPVLKHPLNAESLAKPFQDKLYGYKEPTPLSSTPGANMWTSSVDRDNLQVNALTANQPPPISNWEIDTPYVGRNSRSSDTLPVMEVAGSSKEMPPPLTPSVAIVVESKKKKKKKRRRSSSSSSSSSDDDEPKKESDEAALTRKKKILSKVWTLMAQKKKLETQRDETVLNHKGDGKSLAVLLKENSTLSSEIDRQIFLMNQMVQNINEKLGISKTEAQQQEFFFQPSMYKDSKALQAAGKKALSEKSLQKSITKFLKPSEESSKKSSPPSPARKSKKGSSPSPSRRSKKSSPPSPVRRSKKHRSRSRSKSRSRSRDRKRSPSFEKKVTKKHGSEKKGKKEKSPVVEEIKFRKKKEAKKSSTAVLPAKAKIVEQNNEVEYSPSPAMKPHIKYIDQGMHWCKLCNEFLDNVHDYIRHLESSNHLEKLSSDPKPWLPKPAKAEKDPVDPNAPVITIPLQGLEFIHSITAYFCSLCDTFVKSQEEAQSHSETKLHVSKYKDHLSHNPMYEASYVKDKMAAFAKYSVDKERRKEKNQSLENMKSQDFFGETKNKPDEDADEETSHFLGYPKAQKPPTVNSVLTPSNAVANAASIRVACRSSLSSSIGAEEIGTEHLHSYSDSKLSRGEISPLFLPVLPPPPPPPPPVVEPLDYNKCEKTLDKNDDSLAIQDDKKSQREEEERKLLALKKRVAEYKEHPSANTQKTNAEKKLSEERDNKETSEISRSPPPETQQQQSSKLAIKKYSNVIIGKMPFLKKSKGTSYSKTENKNQDEGLPVTSEAEQRIRQLVSEGIHSLSAANSEDQSAGAFPSTVPRNTEYITEIETCETGTTFTKKFGPTMNPQELSDDEDNSEEAPMDISHDEDSDKEQVTFNEHVPSLMDIPVPVDPRNILDRPSSPLESKLKVDMNNPHLSQLSVAAAMYKDGIAYQPLPMPPTSYLQMPPVPQMMNPPMYPPYSQHPHSIHDDYIDGINPPPPGTEDGNSNQSSVNHDGLDSPDSFLCQKTPPPPGTEDENHKLPQQESVVGSNLPNGQDYFKDMLSDLPVLSYGYAVPTTRHENDEGSQESLVQEGLELLEFADEDEEKSEENLLRNKSPPPNTPTSTNLLRATTEVTEVDIV